MLVNLHHAGTSRMLPLRNPLEGWSEALSEKAYVGMMKWNLKIKASIISRLQSGLLLPNLRQRKLVTEFCAFQLVLVSLVCRDAW
jgi:hypothetical protein